MGVIDNFIIEKIEYIKTDLGCFKISKSRRRLISESDYESKKEIARRHKKKKVCELL